jgi:hypothetical protein
MENINFICAGMLLVNVANLIIVEYTLEFV